MIIIIIIIIIMIMIMITITITITTTTTTTIIIIIIIITTTTTTTTTNNNNNNNNNKNWKTTLNLHHATGSVTSRPINIEVGASKEIHSHQGDSLSPLLFSLALAPLRNLLNRSNYGYESQNGKFIHLFFIWMS